MHGTAATLVARAAGAAEHQHNACAVVSRPGHAGATPPKPSPRARKNLVAALHSIELAIATDGGLSLSWTRSSGTAAAAAHTGCCFVSTINNNNNSRA